MRYGCGMSDATLPRDRHLFGPGPKRILALSGGGVRGALTVAFLERIEALLDRSHGRQVRLAEHFDLIGGTSTGALIAAALAMGCRTAELKRFYLDTARLVFMPRAWQVPMLHAKFDEMALRRQIEAVLGDRPLGTPDMLTGFAAITKRMDTGSVWMVSNNPAAPYWEDGEGYIGNRHYPLANLVRASTAAPHFFDPELLPILPVAAPAPGRRPARGRTPPETAGHGLFIDGGVSPYNNPSLALLQLVSLGGHGLSWTLSPDMLTITSIGTGGFRHRLAPEGLGVGRMPRLAFQALLTVMSDAEKLGMTMMQWLGETAQPWPIDSEIGTMAGDAPPGGKLFRFLRYDVQLEQDWLEAELGIAASARSLAAWRRIDDPRVAAELYRIGTVAAGRQVREADWTAKPAGG